MFDEDISPGVAATLVRPGSGQVTASSVHSAATTAHPAVRFLLDRVDPAMRSAFHGRCPEVVLLSGIAAEAQASLTADGVHDPGPARILDRMSLLLSGAVIAGRLLREWGDPVHERPIPPCSSCAPALDALGVRVVEEVLPA
ncbi:YwqJ-related putative deaminase [Kitasatospora sp. NPDC058218]|uniref:YwqJ-related putative deaminase n=1 Tax=Kitasatospora sp. NPDC058218 TaxID=3346385 RepID=UPI0036D8B3D0